MFLRMKTKRQSTEFIIGKELTIPTFDAYDANHLSKTIEQLFSKFLLGVHTLEEVAKNYFGRHLNIFGNKCINYRTLLIIII